MNKLIYKVLRKMKRGFRGTVRTLGKALLPRQMPYEINVIAENLFVPWAIDISSEGKIYFTERSGTIRVIENGKVNSEPIITFEPPFVSRGEGGLLGIALDPNFIQNHYIYAMHTYSEDNRLFNRVVRLIEKNNKASVDKVIIDKIPGGQVHNGGRIKRGPDKKLYIATGDGGTPSLAQNPTSTAGKILRIELDGSIPKDNPIPNSPVYSLGFRNPQGLTWNSTNILYGTDHGEVAQDEVNIIESGANYGWPIVQGNQASSEVASKKPLVQSGGETWAPAGISFINIGPWQGKLVVGNLRGSQLLVISLGEDGRTVANQEFFLKNEFGRIRDVIQGSDGSIYFTTSNRDGRGNPTSKDDRIIQLTPKG